MHSDDVALTWYVNVFFLCERSSSHLRPPYNQTIRLQRVASVWCRCAQTFAFNFISSNAPRLHGLFFPPKDQDYKIFLLVLFQQHFSRRHYVCITLFLPNSSTSTFLSLTFSPPFQLLWILLSVDNLYTVCANRNRRGMQISGLRWES